MAFGDSPCDKSLQDAWNQFCEQLQHAGSRAFKDFNPATPAHRVDALRFLTQNLGQAFDLALETRDSRYPQLHPFCTPTCKLGGDAADFTYHQAWIDGESAYRVYGNRGSARFINFTLQGQRPSTQPGTDIPSLHEPFGDIPESNLFGHDLVTDSEGAFELFIGGPKRNVNWLPTTPNTRKLFLRQGFDDWNERPAQLHIERIGMNEPRPLPLAADMIEAMEWAGNFLDGVMNDWPDHPYQYSPFVDPLNVNRFPPDPSASAGADDQKRGRAVAHLCWQLQPDEALIIEFDNHDGFWMVSNNGVFFNSMDYRYRPVSYTPARTAVDSDGKVRLILCGRDPGYHNWVDTQGFERGNITYRNLLSSNNTRFTTRLVKTGELADALPADTVRVSPQQRIEQLQARFRSISLRYGL
ncbi:hypothetical protein [Pseudomaricurvus sp. HS19]|uniref:hypothetical protein n=1 Tax=Pseudomaricurvus sp. HS19 TaxID=2692626 RepID=UPI00136B5A1C|nr:hypothetical protein [Pseudomaricurvus sp. HS19]MYM63877.1 hypothetical protein [Pseudomaricurvus sp. HS19]